MTQFSGEFFWEDFPQKEVERFVASHARRKLLAAEMLLHSVSAAAAVAILLWRGNPREALIGAFVFAAAHFLAETLRRRYSERVIASARRNGSRQRLHTGNVTAVLDSKGFSLDSVAIRTGLDWSVATDVKAHCGWLLIFVNPTQAFPFPLSALPADVSEAQLIAQVDEWRTAAAKPA